MARAATGGAAQAAGQTAAQAAQVPAQAAQMMQQLGLVKPGMSIKQITQNLVGALAAHGFGGGDILGLGSKLSAALAAFQQAQGLPVTGKLDAKTVTVLQDMGLMPKGQGESARGQAAQDGFEGGAKAGARSADAGPAANKSAAAQAQTAGAQDKGAGAQDKAPAPQAGLAHAAAEGSQKVMSQLKGLLGLSGGSGPAAGAGPQGGESAQPAAAQAQAQANVAGDASKGAATGARADGENAQARIDGSALASDVAGQKKAFTDEKARGMKGLKDPRERGLEDEGEDDEGDGEAGEHGSSTGDGEGGGAEDGAHQQGAEDGDSDGTERWRGSATSGDTDRSRESGHAQLPEDWQQKPGYYRIPAVAEQWWKALGEIRRDEHASGNRATTYTWDVMFFKPGVYGPGQKAEELLHLVVKEAGAFDVAWPRAVESLEKVVTLLDGAGANAPVLEDVLRAIRQARVRS